MLNLWFDISIMQEHSMRKLVTIRTISEIRQIANADNIELAIVDGWQSVVKKSEFSVGQSVVYFEIDSWVPHDIAPFLSNLKSPKSFNGVIGNRLRTIRLRGAMSQGLIMPMSILDGYSINFDEDIAEQIGVQKWERESGQGFNAQKRCEWDQRIPKTDEERVQNTSEYIVDFMRDNDFEVTEKLEGSSMSVYHSTIDDTLHVCSRNVDLLESDTCAFWNAVTREMRKFCKYNPDYVLRGELIGCGVQGNIYKLPAGSRVFKLYSIYSIASGKYISPQKRHKIAQTQNIAHVPVISILLKSADAAIENAYNMPNMYTTFPAIESAEHAIKLLLSYAEIKSGLNANQLAEGIVLKSMTNGNIHFKAVSNKYLLGES
jgi:RNA ligase (TIGR02306 family)